MRESIIRQLGAYRQSVEQLLEACSAHPEYLLNYRPGGQGWSALQTMHHLILTEELSLQYVQKKLSFNPVLEKRGLGAGRRGFLLWFYLNIPLKFKAPDAVAKAQLPEEASLAETRIRWQSALDNWQRFLEEMPDDLVPMAVYRHPLVGRLGWPETIGFFKHHFQRHRRQITAAIAAAQNNNQ